MQAFNIKYLHHGSVKACHHQSTPLHIKYLEPGNII